ncbi:endopeptidase La [Sinanaerobacter sp. ZZT-01]|uniref:endopeptidase La n=1 Tax=Sinanaerobacter sp. ZZT-01 TaxID=3111540 RepID=UPI002D78E33E|nr:endopeptidase La [Sinanaerobacter sp. ZZT-01]WRR92183.1 endopeptidase La [Sinanaerobacter sp. ZZT-01]
MVEKKKKAALEEQEPIEINANIDAEMNADIEKQDEIDDVQESNFHTMPLIPLRGLTVFPNMVLHFDIGREKSIAALEKAMMINQMIFLTAQKDAETDLPTQKDFYHVGTVAKIKQMLKLPGDNIRVLVEGVCRGEMRNLLKEVPYFKCKVHEIYEERYEVIPPRIVALMRTVLNEFEEYLSFTPKGGMDVLSSVASEDQPGRLADIIASNLDVKIGEKQEILNAFDVEERLEILGSILSREIEILRIENDISSKVKTQMNKTQKEYYLREQIRAIQEELGQDEDIEDEIQKWLKQLKKLKLSAKMHEKIEKEIKRLNKIQPSSAEGGVIRTYIEWVLALPWNKLTKDNIDLKQAKKILDQDHYGLDKVKERVLEYLAVMKLAGSMKGPILCLVGPPGVGKTSIAKSIARAVNRNFVRMSLGGVRDEAEIRGHRRTYIGAIPGRILSAMKDAGSSNPIFLFDEVDKIGADFRGDPASALLEVLDPEQNKEFMDHYLELPFDLSKVMFITTANSIETIPRPLLDRMEIISVSGYTEEEKVKIAQMYLLPKQKKEHGLKEKDISISEEGIRSIINDYTRESGVRNLERELANVCRKAARQVVEGKDKKKRVSPRNIEHYLGKKRYHYDRIKDDDEIGVATGMAWTIVGGDTLFIETTVVPGTGKLVLTGQLGDVMQESAKAGISYIRSHCKQFGISEEFYKEKDLHIHIPEGATPKDGPSAGVTMCTSVISALTNTPIQKEVSMTGEITLRGKVLPVGGIREKVMAAHRAGIKKVLLPRGNEKDIEEIPSVVRKDLTFVLLDSVEDALEEALVK